MSGLVATFVQLSFTIIDLISQSWWWFDPAKTEVFASLCMFGPQGVGLGLVIRPQWIMVKPDGSHQQQASQCPGGFGRLNFPKKNICTQHILAARQPHSCLKRLVKPGIMMRLYNASQLWFVVATAEMGDSWQWRPKNRTPRVLGAV